MRTTDQLNAIFTEMGRTIIEMNGEVNDLNNKFGPSSNITKKRAAQLSACIAFHDAMQEEVNEMLNELRFAAINSKSKDLIIMRNAAGLTWTQTVKLFGGDEGEARSADNLERRLDTFIKELKELRPHGEKE